MSEQSPQIEETIEQWAQARLEALAAEAGKLASRFYLRAAQERAQRPPSEWGRLGVRVTTGACGTCRTRGIRYLMVHPALGEPKRKPAADLHGLPAPRR